MSSNLCGRKFGRLIVLKRVESDSVGHAQWRCVCVCGRYVRVQSSNLLRGTTRSCGCLRREVTYKRSYQNGHCCNRGMSPTRTSWTAMLQRCNNPHAISYPRYGGAGVQVCKRWLKFKNFYLDMGRRPTGTTLRRFLDSGNYTKSNCVVANTGTTMG
jgi:hypothetical protein